MKKAIIILAVLVVLGGAAYLYQRGAKQAKAPADASPAAQSAGQSQAPGTREKPASVQAATTTPQPGSLPQAKASTGRFSSGDEGDGINPDVQVWEVDFDGQNFQPASIDIKLGDIVIFKNKSSIVFWPVSSSLDYADFDAGKSIAAGGRFQFQFTKTGQFGYNDKLSPKATGVVNVSK